MVQDVGMIWLDVLRYIVIAHGSAFVILLLNIISNLYCEVKEKYRSKRAIKFEIAHMLSYLTSIIFMTYTVYKNLHQELLWYVTPMTLLCLIFGDIALYYKFYHRRDNKE